MKAITNSPKSKECVCINIVLLCHHKTRYQPTMNPKQLLKGKPSKRLKNTDCPFSMVFKVKREIDDFPCVVELEWNHNHPVQALQALSFKDIPAHVVDRIRDMYGHGYTPGLAYKELIKGVRIECHDEVDFHWKLADRSKVPRRRDFNQLYTEYNKEMYGSKNLKDMFEKLKERISILKEKDGYKVRFSQYDTEENNPFILALVTPLMKRVHAKVRIHSHEYTAMIMQASFLIFNVHGPLSTTCPFSVKHSTHSHQKRISVLLSR